MGKKTKKVGPAGKYGPRYGVRVRKRLREIDSEKAKWYVCPNCSHRSVKRAGTGIWRCRRCGLVFAGGAYKPEVSPSFKREPSAGPQIVKRETEEEENV
ncbi:MAG: 50S ribosomal protein L37ae [Thermoplasmata archaeon]